VNKYDCEHERGCPHGVVCERCNAWLPKSRSCFPWGSRKPKICATCIDKEFKALMTEANVTWTAK